MKRFSFLSGLLLFQITMSWGQANVPSNLQYEVISNLPKPFQSQTSHAGQRGEHNFAIDYAAYEESYATGIGALFFAIRWPLNNKYKVGTTPTDTLDDFTAKWAAVQFDSLYDYSTGESYPYTGTSITIDSIALYCRHSHTSSVDDTLIVSVLEQENSLSGLTSNDNYVTLTNTVIWDTSIYANTSLSGGNTTTDVMVIPCGKPLNTGQRFLIKVDYKGPAIDTFFVIDFNRADCLSGPPPPGTIYAASVSNFPGNTWRYFNIFYPPSTNYSGVLNASGLYSPSADTSCNKFYFQNLGIAALVTIDVPLSAVVAQDYPDACPGDEVGISVTPTGGTGTNYDVSWSPIEGLQSPSSAVTKVVVSPAAQYPYTLTYTATIIDEGPDTITKVVTINVKGITVDAGTDKSINCGESTTLNAQVGGVLTGISTLWSNGALTTNNLVSAAGTYTVTVENDISNNRHCTASDDVTVSFPGITQTLGFTIDAPNSITCVTKLNTFTNTSAQQGTEWTWQWNFGDGGGNTSLNATYTYDTPGTYEVTLSASVLNGTETCGFTYVAHKLNVQAVCTGIEEAAADDRISLYPNPSEGVFTLSFKDAATASGLVNIYDVRGSLIMSEPLSIGDLQKEFDLSKATNGIYLMKIQSGDNVMLKKLMLNK